MPKDPTRNIERYKIGGTHLNEFEFHQNQGRITEQFEPSGMAPGTQPLTKAEQIAQITAEAHRKVQKHRKQTAKAETSKSSARSKSASGLAKKSSKPVAKTIQSTRASKKSKSGSSKSTSRKAALK